MGPGCCFSMDFSYSDNNEGIIGNTEDDPLVITNTKVKGSVKVTKIFTGIKELPEYFS